MGSAFQENEGEGAIKIIVALTRSGTASLTDRWMREEGQGGTDREGEPVYSSE